MEKTTVFMDNYEKIEKKLKNEQEKTAELELDLNNVRNDFETYKKETETRIRVLSDTAKSKSLAKKRLKEAVSSAEGSAVTAMESAQRTIGELEERVREVEAELVSVRGYNVQLQDRESSLLLEVKKAQREAAQYHSDLLAERGRKEALEQTALKQLNTLQGQLEQAVANASAEMSSTSRSQALHSRLRMLTEIQDLLHTCRAALTS